MEPDLTALIAADIARHGGWIGFERFMALALYQPGLGYYARDDRQFGWMPQSGSDFVTAPQLSPLFGATLAAQVGQALAATGTDTVWEFGAGTGGLASQLLDTLGDQVRAYHIIELSGALRERQRRTLAAHAGRVQWRDAWPDTLTGVVVGNEVLDAMPVQLLTFDGQRWLERGVAWRDQCFVWQDRPTDALPPLPGGRPAGTVCEIGRQAQAFLRSLAARLQRGAAFFIDYGFPEAEFHHPQRVGGTLMCHRAHRADTDPLRDVGSKDITAHLDFSALAWAAQDAGLSVLGYTSQARFLLNCGLLERLRGADARATNAAHRLLAEHEMGELFKVLGLVTPGDDFDAIGFAAGDRCHTL